MKFKYSRSLCSALVLSSVFALSACDGADERKAKYMGQAQESFAQKDYDKAKLGYKNAIQIDPKDIPARMGLAKVLVTEKEWRAAAGQYVGVLEIDKNHIEASVELGKLYLLARGQNEASEQADKILALHPDNIDALTLKAGILAQQQRSQEALDILASLHARDDGHVDSTILYASLLAGQGDADKALSVLARAIVKSPEAVDLLSVKVNVLATQNRHDEALQTMREIIAQRPDNFAHKQSLLAYLARIERFDEAESLLQSYVKEDDEKLSAHKALVDLYVGLKQLDKAESTLKTFIAESPKEYEFQLGLARISLMRQDKDAALAQLKRLIDQDPEGPYAMKARVQIARIALADKKVDEASAQLAEVIRVEPNNPDALMLRGSLYFEQGDLVSAVNDFRIVLKNDPDDANVLRALADTHFKAGEYHLAETYYKQLVTRFPADINARNNLAKIYAQGGKSDQALALRKEIDSISPDFAGNLIDMAKLHMAQNDKAGLQATIDRMFLVKELEPSAHYFAGLLAQSERAHERAIESFDSSLSLSPNAVEPISAKVKSMLALDRKEAAITWLKSVVAEQERNTIARNLYAELLLATGDKTTAEKEFRALTELAPKWHIPYRNLALLFRSENQVDKAIEMLKEGIGKSADVVQLHQELASLYQLQGNIDAAIAEYETLNAIPDAPTFAANNLAMLLAEHKQDAASLERAAQVAEKLRGSDNPMHLDTLGWVYFKRQQIDLALPLIKLAAEKAPEDPYINYHLALAYHSKENRDAAMRHLEKALASKARFSAREAAQELLDKLSS